MNRTDNDKKCCMMNKKVFHMLSMDKRFSFSDIRTYFFITSSIDCDGKCTATQAAMAKELNLSVSQVSKSLKVLRKKDLIRQCYINGNMAYFANPDYAVPGKDLKNRPALCAVYYNIPNELDEKD